MLPQLDTFDIVKQNIIDFVNAGFIAVVPQRNQQVNDWLGMGWIVADPATGSAGYFIAGSLTGTSGVAVQAGGSTTEVTNAADASPDEAQRRQEFAEQLRATGFIVAEVAAVLYSLALKNPEFAKAALVAGLIAVGFYVAAALVERGVLPVPGGRR